MHMTATKAHCNKCGGERNHKVLHSEISSWRDDEECISGSEIFDTLKCCGCELIKLRHTSCFSENDEDKVLYFPPSISRRRPDWFSDLLLELRDEEAFVEALLEEIYVAVQNNLPSLATMGVRALLEKIMISKTGDQGTFAKNIAKFEELGHVSKLQRERLEMILEAGHAAIHRAYKPSSKDVVTLLDIAEHIVESIYLHEQKVTELKRNVPMRVQRGAA